MTFVIGDIACFIVPGQTVYGKVISITAVDVMLDHGNGVTKVGIEYLNFVKHCSEVTADDPVWWHCEGWVPDPCEGVVCDPLCDENADKYETVCDDGVCIRGVLIEENSPDCPGYVPFVCNEGDVRESQTCWDGSTIHKEICRDNAWVASGEVCTDEPDPDPDPDPCENVICPYYCVGVDKWSQKCVINEAGEATCVADALIEKNSAFCGYIPPDPDPDPENKSVAMIIIAAIIAYTLGIIG